MGYFNWLVKMLMMGVLVMFQGVHKPFLTCDSYEFILGTGMEILEGDMG
jgi:hypothetical protein